MKCGHCGAGVAGVGALLRHWRIARCAWRRDIWERVVHARRRGTSGRRILRSAFPQLYPARPMPEDLKARFETRKETSS